MMALGTLFRGGWWRMVRIAAVVGAMGAAAAAGGRLWQETTAHDWRLLGLGAVAGDPKIDWTRNRILDLAGEVGWRGLGAGCALALAALVLLAGWRHSIYGGAVEKPPARGGRGRSAKPSRVRRWVSVPRRMAVPTLAAMPGRAVRIAGIRYPKEARHGHTLVVGATGSGRKALIADLVAGIRARGGRCIVLDRTGEYTRRLFDPARDALLNPLDARAAAWSPLRDARGRGDFEAIAAALVPDPADAGGAVALAARQLFVEAVEALRRRGDAGGGALLDRLLDPAPGALARVPEGTAARPVPAGMHPEVQLPARALLGRHLAALRFGTGTEFSIRDWVECGDGLLFLASPDDPEGRLRGLVSAWLEIALGAMLSLDPEGGRGLWMAIDEPEALHRLPSLLPALGEARGLGVRFAVGIEALRSFRTRYGADGAGTVAGLCATRAALAVDDDETAAWSSAAIGSETLAPEWRLRRLAPGQGVLRFPGGHDAVAFSLKDLRASGAAARFVPVDGARMFLDETPAPSAPARKPPSQTGGPAKRRSKEARPPASVETTGAGNEDGERPEARPARKRRRAGRWI